MAEHTTAVGGHRAIPWRIVGWGTAALILLVPLIAMQLTREVDWTVGDFIFASVLILAVGIPLELVVRKTGNAAYRAGAGLALAAGFLLIWINGAVGITDSVADVTLALLVPTVGFLGAIVARFRPSGMAVAMLATAATVALVDGAALIAGIVPTFNSAFEVLGITAFFVALFVGSALLFREATRGDPPGDAA